MICIFITETFEYSKMAGDREDNVYKAKLAEQAERYDGKRQMGSDEIKGFVCCRRLDGIVVLRWYDGLRDRFSCRDMPPCTATVFYVRSTLG